MTRALVLMKALPPTKGHERLIEFAQNFTREGLVLMDTAPDEPLQYRRNAWIERNSHFLDWNSAWIDADDQDPESDGFWERWKERIDAFGHFDVVIGSEDYCEKVAEVIGARYIPYDPKRELDNSRGTDARVNLWDNFAHVSTDFQYTLRTTVTVWGAESTGKTTLSKALADSLDGEWVFEWARPYLEGTHQTVADLAAMHDIWHGQYAVELNAYQHATDKRFIIRDTDLFSTIGYWEQPHWESELGEVPDGLISQARTNKADLYIITSSNIPFEADPLRYGGDHRESPDEYWISVAEKYGLNYVVLTDTTRPGRLAAARSAAVEAFLKKNQALMYYTRKGQ